MHKITHLWKFKLIGRQTCKRIMEEKKHPCRTTCVLSDAWIWDLSWGLQFHSKFLVRNYFFLKNNLTSVRNYFFLKNNLTSEGALSHNVLYYQKLSAARYQVSFCAKKCFEQLQIVSKRKEFQSSLQFVLFVIITGHRHLLQTGWGKKSTIRESAHT